MYIKIPHWVTSVEAFALPYLRENKKIVKYSEVLNLDGSIKTQQELVDQGIEMGWWAQPQLLNQRGFYLENTLFTVFF